MKLNKLTECKNIEYSTLVITANSACQGIFSEFLRVGIVFTAGIQLLKERNLTLPKTVISCSRDIHDHSLTLHFRSSLDTLAAKLPAGESTVCIPSVAPKLRYE